jgi:uncharacterized membrane protein YhaH (DUF805 family)
MVVRFLSFCFDPRKGPVSQKAYALTGFTLMLLKYCVDALVIWLFSKELINPAAYLSPMINVKKMLNELPTAALLGLSLWTILFIWIGVNLTLRRLQDAGKKSWLALLFFMPFINYLAMLIFAALPTAPQLTQPITSVGEPTETVNSAIVAACIGVCVGGFISVLMVFFTVLHFGDYGGTLFVGTPFVMGFVSSSIFNRKMECHRGCFNDAHRGKFTAAFCLGRGAMLGDGLTFGFDVGPVGCFCGLESGLQSIFSTSGNASISPTSNGNC